MDDEEEEGEEGEEEKKEKRSKLMEVEILFEPKRILGLLVENLYQKKSIFF